MPISSSTVQFLVPELSSGDHSIKVFTQNKSWTLKLTIVEPIGVSGVTLDIGSAAIAKGGSKKLTATVLPQDASDKGVSWSSSDPSIAKVDQNGNVTAISEGSIIITVTTHDGGFTAECDVKVDAKVKVTVSLSKSSLTLAAGESDRITATVEPDAASKKGVTWSSSNESVATVSSTGEVTAVSAGTAVIAATSNEGGARASCTVHVGITVEGITLNAESLEMHIGGSKVLKATLTPPGATDDLLWTSSNGNVATVSGDGKVSALNAGEAVITVTTHDGTLSAECTVTVMDEPVPVVNDDLLLIIAGCIAIIIAIAAAVFVKHRGKHQGSP